MASEPVMEHYAWHVRGAFKTHLGPKWTPDNVWHPGAAPPPDSSTLCGFTMSLAWVPGWGAGPGMRQAETCQRCEELWTAAHS